MMADGELSHAQVWDDSELVDSWNEALEEYKVVISRFDVKYLMLTQGRSTTASHSKAKKSKSFQEH